MAKLGDWERTVWRNHATAEERGSSLLCRWRDGPTRQRLDYHDFEGFLQDHLNIQPEEVEVEAEEEDEEPEVELVTSREQFVENLSEEDQDDFDADDKYVIVYGEDPEGEFGEPLESQPTRDAARERCSELMKTDLHPNELFPDRYEDEEPQDVPEDLEDTLDDESEVEYDYSEIQGIAKSHDIPANQSTEDLVEALVDVREAE